MKRWWCLCLVFALAGVAEAGDRTHALAVFSGVTVNATGTVTSSAINVATEVPLALFLQIASAFDSATCTDVDDPEDCCTGAGTGDCDADAALLVAYSADCSTFSPYVSIVASTETAWGANAEALNRVSFADASIDPSAACLKFQLTGQAGNPTNSVATASLLTRGAE